MFVADNLALLDGTRVVAVLGYEGASGQINGVLAVLDLAARATQPPAAPGRPH